MTNEDVVPHGTSPSASGASPQITGGGISASHPRRDPNSTAFVAPSTQGEANTFRMDLTPVACWSVQDARFAFDSSLVTIDTAEEVRALAELLKEHTDRRLGKPLISIFGHADPVGDDHYNKILSNRRARAVYGLLIHNTDIWQQLYNNSEGIYDVWGDQALNYIRQQLGLSSDDQTPTAQLFGDYMNKITGDFKADPSKDFLGAASGGTPGGKADVQGCSEFNPLRLLPQSEESATAGSEAAKVRNRDNAENRRVISLLFPPGTRLTPSKWPCPTAQEDETGCIKRFWSNGNQRRAIGPVERKYELTHDTFACRFYQRLADGSPCDAVPVFYYGIRLHDDQSWTSTATIHFISEDGQEWKRNLFSGMVSGTSRVFAFSQYRTGVRYRGEIRDGALLNSLFDYTCISAIMAPPDPQNVLLFPRDFDDDSNSTSDDSSTDAASDPSDNAGATTPDGEGDNQPSDGSYDGQKEPSAEDSSSGAQNAEASDAESAASNTPNAEALDVANAAAPYTGEFIPIGGTESGLQI